MFMRVKGVMLWEDGKNGRDGKDMNDRVSKGALCGFLAML
jgi:hypothetical protein